MTKLTNINWKTATHDAWTRDIVDTGMNVIGVLKFDNGRHISRDHAQRLWNIYWHKMDKIFFGHAAAKGFGIERRCFIELGKDGTNLHMHFAALAPTATDPFCAIASAVWVNLDKRTAPYKHNWIMPLLYGAEGAAYTAKITQNQPIDDAGLRNHWRNEDAQQTLGFEAEGQILRIHNAIDTEQFEQAHYWLKAHLAQAEEDRRDRQTRKAHGSALVNYKHLITEYFNRQQNLG
jgi:hypothetical protein